MSIANVRPLLGVGLAASDALGNEGVNAPTLSKAGCADAAHDVSPTRWA